METTIEKRVETLSIVLSEIAKVSAIDFGATFAIQEIEKVVASYLDNFFETTLATTRNTSVSLLETIDIETLANFEMEQQE